MKRQVTSVVGRTLGCVSVARWVGAASLAVGLWMTAFPARGAEAVEVEVEAAVAPRQTLRLFDGHTLSGWHTWLVDSKREDPRRVFSVTNGMIRISGDGLGYLATEGRFRDYRLVVEWRWGRLSTAWGDRIGKARDSGIFLHATGPDGNSHDGRGAFMAAIESNLFQGAVGDFLLIRGDGADGSLIAPRLRVQAAPGRDRDGWYTWRKGGEVVELERWGRVNWFGKSPDWRDVEDFRGPRDLEKRVGRWNRTEIECRGDSIRVILNGVVVNEATQAWPASGRILLQCEGSEIFFRRVELRKIADRR